MSELFWRRILGAEGVIWLEVALLIGLLCIAIWRPQRVGKPALFRMACTLFAISLLVQPIAEVIFRVAVSDLPDSGSDRSDRALRTPLLVFSIMSLAGRILFAFSVVCALGSLDLKRRELSDSGAPSA
jgi:hypothetical protein